MTTETTGRQQSPTVPAELENILRSLETHNFIVTNVNNRQGTPWNSFVLPLVIPSTFLIGAVYDHLRGIGDTVVNYAIALSTEAAKACAYTLLGALVNYALQQ